MLIFQAGHFFALFLAIVVVLAKPQSHGPAIFRSALELRHPSG
ncbi:hypothetical protein [Shinella zoogloeoides]|nr:hypothetical protein [Shinella zoogloeoides]WLR94857.1 hypothetical protein Q9316_08410 [Shinella zoogloeoides]